MTVFPEGTQLVQLPPVHDITVFKEPGSRTVVLPSAAGGLAPYSYTVGTLPAGIAYNPGTRSLEINKAAVELGAYTIRYTATDSDTPANTASENIRVVVVQPPVVYLPPVADERVRVGTQRILTLPVAQGGQAPYSYTLQGLPAGGSFDANTRTLTFPAVAQVGQFSITYTVTDANNATYLRRFTIFVVESLVVPAISDITYNTGLGNVSILLPSPTGGTPPYSERVSNVPKDATYNAATHELLLTPLMRSGVHTLQYSVSDSSVPVARVVRSFKITVNETGLGLPDLPEVPTITDDTQPFNVVFPAAVRNTGTVRYTFTGLPAGARHVAGSRTVTFSSAIAPGRYSVTYTATDSLLTVSRRFVLTRAAAETQRNIPPFSFGTMPTALTLATGQSYSLPVPRGGTPPYTVNLEQFGVGALPDGVVFDRNEHRLYIRRGARLEEYELNYSAYDSSPIANTAEHAFSLKIVEGEAVTEPATRLLEDATGRVIDPATYPEAERIKFDLSETAGRPVRYMPANRPWAFDLPRASGGKGELSVAYWNHPFTRSGRTLSTTGLAKGHYPVDIRVRDANGAWYELRFMVVVVLAEDVFSSAEFEDHHTNPEPYPEHLVVYENSLSMIVSAHRADGTGLLYRTYGPKDGGFFFYRNADSKSLTLSDELLEEIEKLLLDEPGAYVMVHFLVDNPPNEDAAFPALNVPVQATGDELLKLDLQDEYVRRNLGLTNRAVFGRNLAAGSVTAPELPDTVLDLQVINTVEPGTEVGVRHTEKGYEADPQAETKVGVMRTRNTVDRTRRGR